jgi:hypothetical protein
METVTVREANEEFKARQGVERPLSMAEGIMLDKMSISMLADIVRHHWKPKVYFGAVPYLDAMRSLEKITDTYGCDKGTEIVNYFLCNATTWRGDVARAVKTELNRRVKSA